MAKEKTKLKNLEVNKVDFVDAGANQRADIVLAKRQDPELSPENFWKGFMSYIRKHLPAGADTEEPGTNEIEKGSAQSFTDKMSERSLEKTRDEMWSVCYALQSSLISILEDTDLDSAGKKEAMEQSSAEFSQAIGSFIGHWSQGASAHVTKRHGAVLAPKAEVLKSMRDVIDRMIEKAQKSDRNQCPNDKGAEEGGQEEMKIDKSNMTAEDKAAFERMAKSYGWEAEADDTSALGGQEPSNEAALAGGEGLQNQSPQASTPEGTDGVEKGLHPVVRAELEALRKARETYEEKELRDVAKKYEVIGKKADELVPVLKNLKASGADAYDNYVAVLDEMVSMQSASGLFSEIGKSGGHMPAGATEETEAFAKARAKAADIRKSRPELTEEQAIDMAILENPELQEALV